VSATTTTLLSKLLPPALARRQPLSNLKSSAFRAFSGEADGADGLFLDVYADGAVLILYEGRAPRNLDPAAEAAAALQCLAPLGVRAIYLKPFAKDRSKLGGSLPPCATDPTPIAGEPLPESTLITELHWTLEVRLFDGLSTGLFLDQRANRGFVHDWAAARLKPSTPPPRILNTFAYTCAFSVAAAKAGAHTASVDVSGRYLDWGKRNFAHNNLDPTQHHFARMGTFEFLTYAARKKLAYDLIILDPPTFAAGSKKKDVRAWSSLADYARLVQQAATILNPRGTILASTNTAELCVPGRLEKEVLKGLGGLGRSPRWHKLPAPPKDFANDRNRFAALAFS
jgi:23S rRNA (cytosine1962-C5)-methyltransferase